jgi:hypothetical protein
MTHASNPRLLRVPVESVGKCRFDQDGKYRVNENDEEILPDAIPSGVIPGRVEGANPESRDSGSGPSDHPGMTECDYAWLATVLPSAACAAASRAIGTR